MTDDDPSVPDLSRVYADLADLVTYLRTWGEDLSDDDPDRMMHRSAADALSTVARMMSSLDDWSTWEQMKGSRRGA